MNKWWSTVLFSVMIETFDEEIMSGETAINNVSRMEFDTLIG